jgi:hypothetical protein
MADPAPLDACLLAEGLKYLASYSLKGGAPRAGVDAVTAAFVDALLELGDFRAAASDPRRRITLSRAADVARAHSQGATIKQLQERFGHSRQHIHRLLKIHAETVTRHQATVLRSD